MGVSGTPPLVRIKNTNAPDMSGAFALVDAVLTSPHLLAQAVRVCDPRLAGAVGAAILVEEPNFAVALREVAVQTGHTLGPAQQSALHERR